MDAREPTRDKRPLWETPRRMPVPNVSDLTIRQQNRTKVLHNSAATQIRSLRPDEQHARHPLLPRPLRPPFIPPVIKSRSKGRRSREIGLSSTELPQCVQLTITSPAVHQDQGSWLDLQQPRQLRRRAAQHFRCPFGVPISFPALYNAAFPEKPTRKPCVTLCHARLS